MPKDPSSSSATSSRMSDVALRKKKNADAQAAFRARRANYISTLEETVNNLESVVLQLQDSCREARTEVQELRQNNAHLKQAFRERENLWRAMWPRKSNGHSGEADDPLPPPPPPFLQTGVAAQINNNITAYSTDPTITPYRNNDDPAVQYAAQTAPSMSYVDNDVSADARVQKYSQYYNPIPNTESGVATTSSHTNSPHYGHSPTLTSPVMAYGAGRYNGEDQKVPMNTLDAANAYVFPGSRSISPSAGSTPPTSSFNTLASNFQTNYADHNAGGVERSDFDYRRQTGEVMLHGGTADISLASSSTDAVRYRLGTRRNDSAPTVPDRTLLPVLPPMTVSDNTSGSSPHDGGSDDNSTAYPSRLRSGRRDTTTRPDCSRSPSPDGGGPPLSGTLAVIKAQAFGALRRTRTRSKKSDGASKVAIDVLESRGLGMGGGPPPNKRRRLSDDLQDLHP